MVIYRIIVDAELNKGSINEGKIRDVLIKELKPCKSFRIQIERHPKGETSR